ncbi:hypothetical protein PCC9214_01212 [Planktothrix tepida]|uniref:Uncharacterized protein n=2 Tax=Planktothrix TaxID=54304 RepID=A0A1J1LG14_9CYAN|nr:hypothetical protein PCC9214_01212 [Planktothrix tepida]CAD5979747.1 hypothetical protein NO713_04568 [Planktothrix pseudagardhii]CUR31511.1 hypothetical protein PL9214291102 [Planktothrix tepida PCC 9214]
MRLVSVLWGKTWYRYLTNVLDPEELSAQQVCELYRNRWQIEQAFLLTGFEQSSSPNKPQIA